jgi:hypothetical protein
MVRDRIFPAALAAASIAAVCVACAAQTAPAIPASAPLKVKQIHPRPIPMPFSPDILVPESARGVEFRSADQMTEQDRLVEADAEASIAEHAGFEGLEFNEGQWSYRQVVCPALPNHLFLRFTRNNGAGDVSVFSASIPRNGEGRVRIIPILRRSYSLFSPAPVNALTIAAFNHIRTEDGGEAQDWLGIGLCYAALAGANPIAAPAADLPASAKFPNASVPVLEIPERGGAMIHFTDMAATPRPMDWELDFDGKGKLLKAAHGAAPLMPEKAVPPAQAIKVEPLPPTQ